MPESEHRYRIPRMLKMPLRHIPSGYLARIVYLTFFAATATSLGRCYFESSPKKASLNPSPEVAFSYSSRCIQSSDVLHGEEVIQTTINASSDYYNGARLVAVWHQQVGDTKIPVVIPLGVFNSRRSFEAAKAEPRNTTNTKQAKLKIFLEDPIRPNFPDFGRPISAGMVPLTCEDTSTR